jgi:C-terminal processing protease CtpA/Prc
MRGYPGSAGAAMLSYLADKKVDSAHWNIPVILMPDRQGVTYQTSGWNVGPRDPHLKGKVVFITDGRAISYAETCLGIVEAYHLGAIVGSPTAGTNGNVNRIYLPGHYTISFTGMQVIKQDGSRHHGVGIQPTVPASRTIAGIAAGRDELLEKAIEVAQ